MITPEQLLQSVHTRFANTVKCRIEHGQVIVELEPGDLVLCCKILRDESAFKFDQLIDLCGVDYLEYGIDEWATDSATSEGFSRGRSPCRPSQPPCRPSQPPCRPPQPLCGPDEQSCGPDEQSCGPDEQSCQPSESNRTGTGTRPYNPHINEDRFAVVYHLLSTTLNQRLRLKAFLRGEPPMVPSIIDIWQSANWYEREAFDLFGIVFEGHPDLRRILTDYGFIGHPFRKDFPLIGQVEMRYDATEGRVIYEPVSIAPRTLVPKIIRFVGAAYCAGPDLEQSIKGKV